MDRCLVDIGDAEIDFSHTVSVLSRGLGLCINRVVDCSDG